MRVAASAMRVLSLILLAGVACDAAPLAPPGLVTARDLAGTYTGVLQGVAVSTLDRLDDPSHHVIVDLDLLHELTIRDLGALTLRIESPVIPPLRAIVVGTGPVALNVEFVEFDGFPFDSLQVKQIVFVQYEREWIVVVQVATVPVEAEGGGSGVYVHQYVSYPSRVAAQMSESEAIRYVNEVLRLISKA